MATAVPLSKRPREWRGHELSSWWPRVGAEIIDTLVVSALAFPLAYALGFPFIAYFESDVSYVANGYDLVFGLVYLVPALAYFVSLMTLTNGQTLGKRALGIRVVRTDLEPMTAGVATLREGALKTVVATLAWPLGVLNVLWPLWDKERRALHDFAARTRVIRERPVAAGVAGPPPALPTLKKCAGS